MDKRPSLAEPGSQANRTVHYENTIYDNYNIYENDTIYENELPVHDMPVGTEFTPGVKNKGSGYDKLRTDDVGGEPSKYTTFRPDRKDRRNAGYIDMNKNPVAAYENAGYMLLSCESAKTIAQDKNVFVETSSYEKARDLVARNKIIVITGPPGSGKTDIGRALLRHYGDHGYTPLVFRSAEDFHIHLVKSIILLDNVFGKAIVDPRTYPGWAAELEALDRLVQEGENLFIFVLYSHILKQLTRMPDRLGCAFDDMAVVDLGSATPLTTLHKSEMIRRHLDAVKHNSVSDDEINDILAGDKSGPLFPWCCRQYVQFGDENTPTDDDHLGPYVWLAKDPFLSQALAYLTFFKEALQDPQSSEVIAQQFALIMSGQTPIYKHTETIVEKLKQLGFDADSKTSLDFHLLNEMYRGSFLEEDGGSFSSRDIYNAFGFALWETGKVELLLKAADVRFLVQHVHIEAQETGPTFILTRKSPRYFDFIYRLMAEITGGNLLEISQHPALHHASILADLERFLQGRGLLETALSTADSHYGMTLLYWSAWTAPSQLTQWCLRTRGTEASPSGPEWGDRRGGKQADSTHPDSGGPEVVGTSTPENQTRLYFELEAPVQDSSDRPKMPQPDRTDWSRIPEPEQTTSKTTVPRKSALTTHGKPTSESLASGTREPLARVTETPYLLAGPPTDVRADMLKRTFLACCLLGEKVHKPRVADMLEMLCQDAKALDEHMAPVLLPVPPQEHVLTAACRDRCSQVRESTPAFYLGLSAASPGATSTSHVSIPTSIVTVERTLSREGVWVKPNTESCGRWYTLIRLLSMWNVNEPNRDGYTLLHTAAFNGELSVVWFLAVNGATLSATSSHGNTPLTKAIDRNQVKVATFLLLHACNGRKPNIQDLTKLCGQRSVQDLVRGAVVCKRVDMLKLLLSHGADPNSHDAKGRSLLTLARAVHDNDEVIRVLKKHGAKEPKEKARR